MKNIGNKTKNKWVGQHQTEKFLHSEGNTKMKKDTTLEWEEVFTNHISDRELIAKKYKELV